MGQKNEGPPNSREIVPVLAALIRNETGAYLLARRKSTLANGGKWEFPGGKLRGDETPEEGLRREIREELGIGVEVLGPRHLVRHRYPHLHILLIGYACRWVEGDLKPVDHDQIAWVMPGEMTDYELSAADIALAHYLSNDSC
ncbi:MAG TPA: (deoxy)nucleoside triphosphate pyrophosphohydrolase [Calditrichia bacterium]|nr:(deoxy)nucleoside triphosphate pyrophosphohydrolase [Calditrichota bacterium]HQU71474.1 (deoxy)nucleoside triphosphate pyrophosphohydrolase [Calditrichia bacterium]HQV33376.1 (deoxy)nucleoside triphosphate pyrophosphohydrolase [Calditrichia bacterium]